MVHSFWSLDYFLEGCFLWTMWNAFGYVRKDFHTHPDLYWPYTTYSPIIFIFIHNHLSIKSANRLTLKVHSKIRVLCWHTDLSQLFARNHFVFILAVTIAIDLHYFKRTKRVYYFKCMCIINLIEFFI